MNRTAALTLTTAVAPLVWGTGGGSAGGWSAWSESA